MSPPSLLLLSLPLFHPLSLLSIPPPLLSPLPTPPPSSAPPLLSSQPICHIHHHCRGHYYYSILSLLSSTPPLLFPLPLSLPSQSHRHRYHHNIVATITTSLPQSPFHYYYHHHYIAFSLFFPSFPLFRPITTHSFKNRTNDCSGQDIGSLGHRTNGSLVDLHNLIFIKKN